MTDTLAGAVQPPLFRPGWEVEPCGDAEAEVRPEPIAYRGTETVVVTGGVL